MYILLPNFIELRSKKMTVKVFVICFVFASVSGNPTSARNEEDNPVVCFGENCVMGKRMKGNLKEFEGFYGIPFAKPPISDLRLRDPQPITEKFKGIYDATQEKIFCAQKNYLIPNPSVMGVEDCLYLYVYRPMNWQKKKPMPVIVYIHGGGFFAGASGPSFTGADYFMDSEDVIFVSISYRLGPLGFLSTGDEKMSGNFGLKDQAMAIKWVKENIRAFGGDPENISLMGQSAGASCVHLHMMSNLTKNLFHKVILLSGNGNGPYAYVIKDPLEQSRKFALAAGIKNAESLNKSSLVDELRKVDAELLINASDALKIWSIDPLVISKPVVEDCSKGNGFLCEDPIKLWRNGNYSRIPMISGYMDGDGAVRALNFVEDEKLLKSLNENFDELFPQLIEFENTQNRLQMVKSKYFKGENRLTNSSVRDLVQLYTDRSFMVPLANTMQQKLDVDENSGYVYKFSFKGGNSYSFFYTGNFKDYGIVHCDELIYLLKSPLLFPIEFDEGSVEAEFRKKFVKFFTHFVAFGKPYKINGKTPQKCFKTSPNDIEASKLRCPYIDFNKQFTLKTEHAFDENTVDFWNLIDNTMFAN